MPEIQQIQVIIDPAGTKTGNPEVQILEKSLVPNRTGGQGQVISVRRRRHSLIIPASIGRRGAIQSYPPSIGGQGAIQSYPPSIGGQGAIQSYPASIGRRGAIQSYPPSIGGQGAIGSQGAIGVQQSARPIQRLKSHRVAPGASQPAHDTGYLLVRKAHAPA